jgi:hypothetical protein
MTADHPRHSFRDVLRNSVRFHTQLHTRCRVPAVYLAHAILAIVAILAVRGMNKLRVPNGPDGSIPTAPTKSPMF